MTKIDPVLDPRPKVSNGYEIVKLKTNSKENNKLGTNLWDLKNKLKPKFNPCPMKEPMSKPKVLLKNQN